MLTDLMRAQQAKLVHQIQEKPGYVDPDAVAALALIDILEVLHNIDKNLQRVERNTK